MENENKPDQLSTGIGGGSSQCALYVCRLNGYCFRCVCCCFENHKTPTPMPAVHSFTVSAGLHETLSLARASHTMHEWLFLPSIL